MGFHGFDGFAAKENLALVRRVETRDAIEERRFSCAVGTDDAQDLSFCTVKSTAETAVSPPNRFVTPLPSKSVSLTP